MRINKVLSGAAVLMVVLIMCPQITCVAEQLDNIFKDHPNLEDQKCKLVEDYLEGQKNGESAVKASEKYGDGVTEFYALKEYRLEKVLTDSVIYRILATNQMGGTGWSNYGFTFSYDAKRDTYGGLRIHIVLEV